MIKRTIVLAVLVLMAGCTSQNSKEFRCPENYTCFIETGNVSDIPDNASIDSAKIEVTHVPFCPRDLFCQNVTELVVETEYGNVTVHVGSPYLQQAFNSSEAWACIYTYNENIYQYLAHRDVSEDCS